MNDGNRNLYENFSSFLNESLRILYLYATLQLVEIIIENWKVWAQLWNLMKYYENIHLRRFSVEKLKNGTKSSVQASRNNFCKNRVRIGFLAPENSRICKHQRFLYAFILKTMIKISNHLISAILTDTSVAKWTADI